MRQSGEKHPKAKLTKKMVKEIRDAYEFEKTTYRDLAEKYGVSASAISKIVRLESWK